MDAICKIARQIDADIIATRADISEIAKRMTALDERLANLRFDFPNHAARFDRIDRRLARIEDHLEAKGIGV